MKNTKSKTVIILLFILLCACKKETTKYITTKYIPNQIGIWKGSSLSSTGMNTPLLLEIIADSIAMSYDGNPPAFITYPILRGNWVIKDYAFTAKLPYMPLLMIVYYWVVGIIQKVSIAVLFML